MSPIRPSERAKYPPDWPAIRNRILERAGRCCEFTMADGRRCSAPDGRTIARLLSNLEHWRHWEWAEAYWPPMLYRTVDVVLTIAHLDHNPANCTGDNLKAACQLHHLRYDHGHHQRTAAMTRRARKHNQELFDDLS